MTKQEASNITSVNFRFGPITIQQLVALGVFHGNRTRAVIAAVDRLYQETLRTNPAFAEFVAEGTQPAGDTSEE